MSQVTLDRGLAPARRVLSNGATVLAERTATHPAVTILVSLHAGSGYDPTDGVGLAHFVSRVIDRGTATRTADDITELLDGRGVSLNIGVGRHPFTIACTCLAEDLEDVLDLVADILRHPSFADDEVATRRAELVTWIRQDADTPSVLASEGLMERIYPGGHPYGRLTKGTLATVESIGAARLRAFHASRFAPSGMIVVLVGDVDRSRALDAASAAFADWDLPPVPRLDPPPAPRPASRTRAFVPVPGKAQSEIAYGYAALRRLDPDHYALVLMNNVLGQYGLGGRLGDSIRERQGMAYYVFSSYDGNVGEGPLVVRAGVAPGNVERTVASIDEEIGRLVLDGVTPAELADAKRYLVGSLPRQLETNGGIAAFLQSAEFFGLGLDLDRRLPSLLEAVTLDEVRAVTARVLDPGRATIVVAGPPHADDAAAGA
jgi:zinc protease